MPALTDVSPPANTPLFDAIARWRAVVESELKGVEFEKKLVTRTPEGIALQPLYTRSDTAGLPALACAPGAAPFWRGVREHGYATQPWEVAQRIAAATPAEFNAALLGDLMAGQNAVVLAPDTATRRGCDPDTAAANEVGSGGVSIADANDVETALRGVDLAAVPVHLAAGADATALAALFLESARRRGTGWTTLKGSVTADPISTWASTGVLPAEIDPLFDSLAGWTRWVETYSPDLRTIGVDAALWDDAGATATQELAFALATATAYVRELTEREVAAKEAVQRVVFGFSSGPQFFAEIAKFRAFRPLWTRVVSAFGVEPGLAATALLSARTARWNKTLLDPHVNMLRVTTEALSAVLGGCDTLHVAPFDEVSGTSTEFSRRIARNVHTLLAEEFNFTATADPAGGSWYVEKLTDQIARSAWGLFQEIEGRGGMLAVLKSGYVQQLVSQAAAEKRDAVAKRRLGLVGTNLFPNLREKPLTTATSAATEIAALRGREIAGRRTKQFAPAVGTTWAARFDEVLSAARAGATIAQLSAMAGSGAKAMDTVARVESERVASGFEQLRTATASFAERTGGRPRVFLAKMGPTAQHKARADFSAGFFATAGFETLGKQTFDTAEAATQAAIRSGTRIAVLCSTDETYADLVPAFGQALKQAAPETIFVLAGLPSDAATVARFREFGVDEFIHLRANVHATLGNLLKQTGVLV